MPNLNIFDFFRRKKIDEIIERVNKKGLLKRYILLALGVFLVAFAFNVFFNQFNIVCFGISGLSIVLKQFGVPPALFILLVNLFLLVLSFILLGTNKTKNSVIGSLMFPFFVSITEKIVPYIPLQGVELLVIAVFGAVITGMGYGLIYKTGFTTGGTDIINQIISKYTKVSIGKAMLITDGLVVLSGKIVFTWEIVLYGFIVLYIISMITDKVILGISQSKAFYIVTNKEEEVRHFMLSITDGGVTLIKAKGGYSNENVTMLLAVIPTRQYYFVKEGLSEIDKNIFFLVCDAYEVSHRGLNYEE